MNGFWTPTRAFALLVVATYIGLAARFFGAEAGLRMLAACLLPLLCVWFPDGLSTWFGYGSGWVYRRGFTGDTPPVMVALGGWLLLAMPPIIAVIWFTSIADR